MARSSSKRRRKNSPSPLKLLNQGSYGCIYRPSLRCGAGQLRAAQRDGGDYLSKLQSSGRAAQTEIAIGAKVAKIPRFAQRFAPVISSCPVVRAQIPTGEKAFRDCKALQKGNKAELVLMKMPVAGSTTLAKYLQARQKKSEKNDDDDDGEEGDAAARFTNRLAGLYHVLCDSLALLASASIVHNDLKDNNIMYNTEKHAPVIIDFGLSLDVAILLRSNDAALWRGAFYAYQPDYGPWGPESVLCSALWQGSERESRPTAPAPDASGGTMLAATPLRGGGEGAGEEAAGQEEGAARNSADVLEAEEIAALSAVVTTCFARHPSLRSVRARRPGDVEAKLQRMLQQVQALRGLTRVEAARRVLQESWRRWDRFALAGVLLPYKKTSSTAAFWNQVDADVLA